MRRTCCGRKRKPTNDFCAGLRISTGVTLAQSGGAWAILISSEGRSVEIGAAIKAHNCGASAGARLAEVSKHALSKAVAAGKSEQLKQKAGRQIPLILLKDFLFKTAGTCSSCNGRGCFACSHLGV